MAAFLGVWTTYLSFQNINPLRSSNPVSEQICDFQNNTNTK